MGQHTWFYKDRKLYEEQQEIYDKLNAHEEGEIWLESEELLQLNHREDEIYRLNEAEYHDLFRTSKRDPDGCYTTDFITSQKDCKKWLEDNKDLISIEDWGYKLLDKFWNKYPNGVIDFG